MTREPLSIGCAAGFSGDRTDVAGPVVDSLIRRGGAAVLMFETLAERTLALAQLARRDDPEKGYEPLLDEMISPILARCLDARIRIVSNMGAANPFAAARRIRELARLQGLRAPRIAVVSGDDLSDRLDRLHAYLPELTRAGPIVSANAYVGCESIARALAEDVDLVITGRVADPSLALGPAMAHFGWAWDDWDKLAAGTMAGHLLECGSQVTGGYYADPGYKDVPGMATLGFPIASIDADGRCTLGKADGTGGCLDEHTVIEQLLYELHDPAAYLTPDVVADITQVRLETLDTDVVRMIGVRGHPRPDRLKVNVCHENGWLAEGEISYAGARAERRARLAAGTVRERLAGLGPVRADLIGVASIFGDDGGRWLDDFPPGDARDVRLRLALNHADRASAERLTREVTALYCCGPAGGGGVRTSLRARLGTLSGLVPREMAPTRFEILE